MTLAADLIVVFLSLVILCLLCLGYCRKQWFVTPASEGCRTA